MIIFLSKVLRKIIYDRVYMNVDQQPVGPYLHNEDMSPHEPDVSSKDLLPLFVANTPLETSLVKSVRTDFTDVSPYYAKTYEDKLVRTEYSLSQFNGVVVEIKLESWPCHVTRMEILNGDGITYTLNINRMNTASILSTLNITDKCTKSSDTILSTLCQLSRDYAVKNANGNFVPEEHFLTLMFDCIRLHCPKTAVIPRVLRIAITGYYNGSNKLETKVMSVYPYDRYSLCLSNPTDYLSIMYEQTEQGADSIALHMDTYRANIYPRKKKGILVVKLQNPEDDVELLNLSQVSDIFINAPGYKIKQVVSCYRSTYTLPHYGTDPAGTFAINGPLCPLTI